MTSLDSLGPKIGGRCKQRTISFTGMSYKLTASKSPLAAMQNFATFE